MQPIIDELISTDDWEYGVSVTNFDAHHDFGYRTRARKRSWDCGDWARWLQRASQPHGHVATVYPEWRRELPEIPPRARDFHEAWYFDGWHDRYNSPWNSPLAVDSEPFDFVFICRSGAWVPPWLDEEFDQFIAACPCTRRTTAPDLLPRTWSPMDARAIADAFRAMTPRCSQPTIPACGVSRYSHRRPIPSAWKRRTSTTCWSCSNPREG